MIEINRFIKKCDLDNILLKDEVVKITLKKRNQITLKDKTIYEANIVVSDLNITFKTFIKDLKRTLKILKDKSWDTYYDKIYLLENIIYTAVRKKMVKEKSLIKLNKMLSELNFDFHHLYEDICRKF